MAFTTNAPPEARKPTNECQVTTQETFEGILDTLPDGYFEAGPSGVLTYVNQAFANAVGASSKQDVIGKHFRHFTSRKIIRSVYQNFKRLYGTKKPIEPFEFMYCNTRGDEFTSEIVVSPIFDGTEVVGSRGIVRDISARVEAEALLREAKEAAEKRAVQLAALNRVGATVSRSLKLREVLNSICQELTIVFRVRNAGIALLTPDKKWLEVVAFHTSVPEEKSALGIFLPYEGNTSSQEVINKKKTVVIQDAQNDPGTITAADIYKVRGTKAIMIVPLLAHGEAIGTIGMPALDPDHIFTQDEVELAETIASQVATAVENARLYSKTELALDVAEHDLEIGRQIQSGFFPEKLPVIPGWEIASYFHPARQVSGDFYDAFQIKNSSFTAFVIADVCDKGVGAALFMVLFRSLLRAFSELRIKVDGVDEQLRRIIMSTNNFIAEYHGKSNMFATLFFGILDPEAGVLYYVNGGHEPPALIDQGGLLIQRLNPTGPAVGLFPDLDFHVEQVQFREGDFLVGFTDGSTDARNSSGTPFSEDRLLKEIEFPWTSIFSLVFQLSTELKRHIGELQQFDDITLLGIRRRTSTGKNDHAICRKANIEILGELVDFVESAAVYSGLNHETVFAFKVAADEICTNIINYGFKGRDPGMISLFFDVYDRQARLVIRDDGIYFPPDQAKKPDLGPDWESKEMGGLGLYFVSKLMDEVTYSRTEEDVNQFILIKEISTSKGKKE